MRLFVLLAFCFACLPADAQTEVREPATDTETEVRVAVRVPREPATDSDAEVRVAVRVPREPATDTETEVRVAVRVPREPATDSDAEALVAVRAPREIEAPDTGGAVTPIAFYPNSATTGLPNPSISPLPAPPARPVTEFAPQPAARPAPVEVVASQPTTTANRYYDPSYRPAVGNHYVSGHFRSDGTFVQGHYKTNPDGSFWNNWSTVGNTNPMTGSVGTKLPPVTNSYSAAGGAPVATYRPSSSYSARSGGYVRPYVKSSGTFVSGHYRRGR